MLWAFLTFIRPGNLLTVPIAIGFNDEIMIQLYE